jgi:hypothetical protein
VLRHYLERRRIIHENLYFNLSVSAPGRKEQGEAEKSGTRISTSVYQLRKREEERREEILNTNFTSM